MRERTYELLSRVRAPSQEEQEALEKTGWVFFSIAAISLRQLVKENPDHFGYVKNLGGVIDYIPPSMIAAINPEQFCIPDSFGRPQDDQLAMIEQRSLARQRDFPDAREVMLTASALAQLGIASVKKTGETGDMLRKIEALFFEFRARALDDACVGRNFPILELDVVDDARINYCCAFPAVVFVRK